MPRFEPFNGLLYDLESVDLGRVTAPPYDVIDEELRAELAARDPHQAVRLDLPTDEPDSDRYRVACRLLGEWRGEGVLVEDPAPAFYVYRMDHTAEDGSPRHTTGVIGALELSRPGEGGILPHEQTTPKAKSDRLEMLRSCRANLSSIWGLSPAPGLTSRCERADDLLGDWADDDGVRHRLWRVVDPALIAEIEESVGSHPVVIADGHHRYETSLAYRDERRAEADQPSAADLVMCLVVELSEDELSVEPIHRLVSGLPDGFDLRGALAEWFEVEDAPGFDAAAVGALVDRAALGLVDGDGSAWLTPRRELVERAGRDLDTVRLDVALGSLPGHELAYQHGVDHVTRAVGKGDATAGFLLRPATVGQILEIADGGDRMPPKTTFFHPKPRTGTVFRLLD